MARLVGTVHIGSFNWHTALNCCVLGLVLTSFSNSPITWLVCSIELCSHLFQLGPTALHLYCQWASNNWASYACMPPCQHLVPLMFFKVCWKCASVELFFFLAWVKVANEGVWPMRAETKHTHTHAHKQLGVSLVSPWTYHPCYDKPD